jgi:hypothetical protein
VPHSLLAHSPRAVVLVMSSSEGSSSSSSSLPASLSLGVREASVVEKALPVRRSTLVPSLQKDKDLEAAQAVNLISVPPIDATSVDADLIILSSGSEDELLPTKMTMTLSPWVVGPRRGSDGGLGVLPLALALMLV